MRERLNRRYSLGDWLYYCLLVLLLLQAGLNILRRFVPLALCQQGWFAGFLDFPSLPILLVVLYCWPIKLRSRPLQAGDSGNVMASQPNKAAEDRKILAILLAGFLLLLQFMLAAIAPEVFDSYRILLVSMALVIFPFHAYSNLATRRNHPLVVVALVELLPLIILFYYPPGIIQYILPIAIAVLSVALVSWSLYALGLWRSNRPDWLTLCDRYNPFARQPVPTESRKTSLQLIALSGLAGLVFLASAYLRVPRIQTFGLYENAFNQVVALAKANQLQPYSAESPQVKMPCRYTYLAPRGVRVMRENNSLTVEFRLFSIGFGDGYTAFVYRSQPLDYKQAKTEVDVKALGDSWYWEQWNW